MANVTRVRVEIKNKYNDPYKNFKEMFAEFKRRVSSAGILADFKEHEFYESKSEKKRKKRRAAVAKRQSEMVEEKILSGERVKAPGGLIKKIMSNQNKKKRKPNNRDR